MGEGDFPKSDGDVLYASEINVLFNIVPIGAILPWAKSIPGVPSLPANFVECSGQTLSDADSPLNGKTIPNLNGGIYRMLRGSSTSGTTAGSDTHNHGGTTGSVDSNPGAGDGNSSTTTFRGTLPHSHTISNVSNLPAYYEVVFIMRVK